MRGPEGFLRFGRRDRRSLGPWIPAASVVPAVLFLLFLRSMRGLDSGGHWSFGGPWGLRASCDRRIPAIPEGVHFCAFPVSLRSSGLRFSASQPSLAVPAIPVFPMLSCVGFRAESSGRGPGTWARGPVTLRRTTALVENCPQSALKRNNCIPLQPIRNTARIITQANDLKTSGHTVPSPKTER